MREIDKWFKINGDNKLRLNYELNENSIVFDLGGYKGEWSNKIYNKYNCNIYIFEPIPNYYNLIKEKFKNINKIKIYNLGVSDKNDDSIIYLNKDASSTYVEKGEKIKIKNIKLSDFLKQNNINNVDLIKINVEGEEYKILNELIENNKIKIFDNLQIQFHKFVENCKEMRKNIQNELSKTHKLTYNYEFIWENWNKNK